MASASCLAISCSEESSTHKDDDACAKVTCNSDQECVDGECRDKAEKDACDNACETDESCVDGVCRRNGDDEEVQDPDAVSVPGSGDDNGDTDDISSPDDMPDTSSDPVDVKGDVMVTPVDGLFTRQDGTKAFFSVLLNNAPSEDVVIPVVSDDENIGTPSPSELTFTKSNWSVPQVVSVTGTAQTIERDTLYHIVVGPTQSKDGNFSGINAVQVDIMHYNNPVSTDEPVKVEKIMLSVDEIDILKSETQTITATLSSKDTIHAPINWEFENITEDEQAAKDDCYQSIAVSYLDENSEMISITNITKNARRIKVTAKCGELSASAVLNLKPYLPLTMPLSELLKIKNFNAPGQHRPSPKTGETMHTAPKLDSLDKLGNLACDTYDEYSNKVYYTDLYEKIVRAKMYHTIDADGKTSYYPTRASVTAAARFLVLQFPYDIPYANKIRTTNEYFDKKYTDDGSPVVAHYVWSSTAFNEDSAKVRVYGLNLTSNVHGATYDRIIKTNAVPWACQRYSKDPSGYRSNNGIECTGLVTWALRNGRVGLGDWVTEMFAKSGKCKDTKTGLIIRNYHCINIVNNKDDSGNYKDSSSIGLANNYHDGAYTKLSRLEESDFIPVSKLTEDDIKAGDILWLGNYKYSTTACSPSFSGGHVAMIIGVERGSDNHIQKIHYAEAGYSAGNTLTSMTWSEFTTKDSYQTLSGTSSTNRWHKLYGKKTSNGCEASDARLIKMDKVYNYPQTKGDLPADAEENLLNKYEYTDFWR